MRKFLLIFMITLMSFTCSIMINQSKSEAAIQVGHNMYMDETSLVSMYNSPDYKKFAVIGYTLKENGEIYGTYTYYFIYTTNDVNSRASKYSTYSNSNYRILDWDYSPYSKMFQQGFYYLYGWYPF